MIQFLAGITALVAEVRTLNLSEAQFNATMRGCLLSIKLDAQFTEEQKAIAETILLGAKR